MRLIFAEAEWKFIILNFLGKEDLGEGRAQEGLSGCWRVKRAVVLLHFQQVQPRLGAAAGESQC